ncbi:hypothetical protein K461DRAFT_110292 [Myriangium duriaei CBS 260.36]|uniref:Ubiquitination network signaling protein n=1 Tax=Myriangium duriaei CBS 260.36 TaxID=1168546 RepID=A0A9P4MQ28_9PEZI|nr:hypothetical protein K461DRAFT_110292 [Myriangium duriaei CBS 260.36]
MRLQHGSATDTLTLARCGSGSRSEPFLSSTIPICDVRQQYFTSLFLPPHAYFSPTTNHSRHSWSVGLIDGCCILHPSPDLCLPAGGALMPPKARIKHANQHDKRHDAGLAAPGKRISKEKDKEKHQSPANGHTHSSANGRSQQPSTPPLSQTSTAVSSTGLPPRPELQTTDSDGSGTAGERVALGGNQDIRERAGVDAGVAAAVDNDIGNMNHKVLALQTPHGESAYVKDAASTLKSLAAQASSTLALAATILSACPLRDAIAILILLLSLHSSFVIVIHGLFASLTFVPPAVGFSWGSWSVFPSFGDWFHATPGGGPSPFTILFSDLVMTLIHLACPLRLQNIFMELSQAVIAISLSGAAAGTGSSTRNVAFCSTIIVVNHLARYRSAHITSFQYFVSVMRNIGLDVGDYSMLHSDSSSIDPTFPGWARLLLGCHILAQGLLTLLRRWVAGANQKPLDNRLDAEQAALLDSGKLAMLNLDNSDAVNSGTLVASSSTRESKDKASNRKKRKQANQVRSQQPLWAALASTKVTFLKEMEQKYLADDKKEAASHMAPDKVPRNVDRIWILDIGPTSIRFRAELLGSSGSVLIGDNDQVPASPGLDKQKPFFARLNGADWGSARIVGVGGENSIGLTDDRNCKIWVGEIYGLSPLTKYSCEFVSTRDQHVIFTTNLITLPAPNAEQGKSGEAVRCLNVDADHSLAVTAPAPSQHQSLRPMSPTSTLKQSIIAAEAKREEVRNKLKRTRKDHKTSATAVRRDIEQLQTKVASSGGQDERSRQRILQLKQHVKQAEDALETLKEEGDSMGDVPKGDLDSATARRKSYDTALEAKSSAKAEVDSARLEANKVQSALQAEISSISQKRDRLHTRRARVNEQYDKLVSEQNADVNARQYQRAQALDEREKLIEQLVYWINYSRSQEEEANIRANEIYQQIQQGEQNAQLPPPTPEGNLPGTNGPRGPVAQPFEFPPFGNLNHPGIPAQKWGGPRQRSSSMLSGYSGFTEDYEIPGQNGHYVGQNGYDRKGSSGGGSGSSGRSVSESMVPQVAGNFSHGPGHPWGMMPQAGSPGPMRAGSTDFAGR